MKFRTLIFTIIFTTGLCPLFGNELYKSNVTASFYAEDFNGKVTSSGEIFNMNDLTCAHKSLPFNSILKITNLSTGATALVRVNDRGPFVLDREIDLSKAAAIQLGMFGSGTAAVDIEIVVRGPDTELSLKTAAKALAMMQQLESEEAAKKAAAEAAVLVTTTEKPVSTTESAVQVTDDSWDVQLGAFASRENANTLAQRLLKSGFTNVVFQTTNGYTKVVIRCVQKENLDNLTKELKEKGFGEYTVRKRANVIEITGEYAGEK